MTQRKKLVAVECKVSRGGFSGERIVYITEVSGNERRALAPVAYCFDENMQPFNPDEPPAGKLVSGFVFAILLGSEPTALVISTPDGDRFVVPNSQVRPVAPELSEHVPV